MARQIKYRVWDIGRKQMIYPESKSHNYGENNIAQNGGLGYYLLTQKGIVLCNDGIVMDDWHNNYIILEFTGFTDKNGKEIYDGDIIKDSSTLFPYPKYAYEVYFDEKFQWSLRHLETKKFDSTLISSKNIDVEIKKQEIVGNIYKNVKLLKKPK